MIVEDCTFSDDFDSKIVKWNFKRSLRAHCGSCNRANYETTIGIEASLVNL